MSGQTPSQLHHSQPSPSSRKRFSLTTDVSEDAGKRKRLNYPAVSSPLRNPPINASDNNKNKNTSSPFTILNSPSSSTSVKFSNKKLSYSIQKNEDDIKNSIEKRQSMIPITTKSNNQKLSEFPFSIKDEIDSRRQSLPASILRRKEDDQRKSTNSRRVSFAPRNHVRVFPSKFIESPELQKVDEDCNLNFLHLSSEVKISKTENIKKTIISSPSYKNEQKKLLQNFSQSCLTSSSDININNTLDLSKNITEDVNVPTFGKNLFDEASDSDDSDYDRFFLESEEKRSPSPSESSRFLQSSAPRSSSPVNNNKNNNIPDANKNLRKMDFSSNNKEDADENKKLLSNLVEIINYEKSNFVSNLFSTSNPNEKEIDQNVILAESQNKEIKSSEFCTLEEFNSIQFSRENDEKNCNIFLRKTNKQKLHSPPPQPSSPPKITYTDENNNNNSNLYERKNGSSSSSSSSSSSDNNNNNNNKFLLETPTCSEIILDIDEINKSIEEIKFSQDQLVSNNSNNNNNREIILETKEQENIPQVLDINEKNILVLRSQLNISPRKMIFQPRSPSPSPVFLHTQQFQKNRSNSINISSSNLNNVVASDEIHLNDDTGNLISWNSSYYLNNDSTKNNNNNNTSSARVSDEEEEEESTPSRKKEKNAWGSPSPQVIHKNNIENQAECIAKSSSAPPLNQSDEKMVKLVSPIKKKNEIITPEKNENIKKKQSSATKDSPPYSVNNKTTPLSVKINRMLQSNLSTSEFQKQEKNIRLDGLNKNGTLSVFDSPTAQLFASMDEVDDLNGQDFPSMSTFDDITISNEGFEDIKQKAHRIIENQSLKILKERNDNTKETILKAIELPTKSFIEVYKDPIESEFSKNMGKTPIKQPTVNSITELFSNLGIFFFENDLPEVTLNRKKPDCLDQVSFAVHWPELQVYHGACADMLKYNEGVDNEIREISLNGKGIQKFLKYYNEIAKNVGEHEFLAEQLRSTAEYMQTNSRVKISVWWGSHLESLEQALIRNNEAAQHDEYVVGQALTEIGSVRTLANEYAEQLEGESASKRAGEKRIIEGLHREFYCEEKALEELKALLQQEKEELNEIDRQFLEEVEKKKLIKREVSRLSRITNDYAKRLKDFTFYTIKDYASIKNNLNFLQSFTGWEIRRDNQAEYQAGGCLQFKGCLPLLYRKELRVYVRITDNNKTLEGSSKNKKIAMLENVEASPNFSDRLQKLVSSELVVRAKSKNQVEKLSKVLHWLVARWEYFLAVEKQICALEKRFIVKYDFGENIVATVKLFEAKRYRVNFQMAIKLWEATGNVDFSWRCLAIKGNAPSASITSVIAATPDRGDLVRVCEEVERSIQILNP